MNGTIQNGGYFLLIAGRAFYCPDDTVRKLFARHLKPNFELFLELMRDALPDVSERVLLWRIHFTIGSLAHAMHLCGFQLPIPAEIFPPIENAEYMADQLLSFLTCGMRAPCQAGIKATPEFGGQVSMPTDSNERAR
ncbi:hypothetical protein [Desulfosarcina cetonica]|uniref:hypothetical protein n=1 Tax=Desulfosarcina cetonica TaxID=90730 RepID=UPI0006D278CA|nr:hypothetical protein [Desulfosarcina cetonica]